MCVGPSTSYSSTPDTPDSGYWDVSLEYSPSLQGQDSWNGAAVEGEHLEQIQHAPLPELSLHEILGELGEAWLGGEGLGSRAAGEKMAPC